LVLRVDKVVYDTEVFRVEEEEEKGNRINNNLFYDWPCMHGTTSVDSAVSSLNSVVQDASEHKFPLAS
jgi:hypothetical protein